MAKKRITLETPEKVKILGICGSPRKANTYEMVKFTLEAAESMGYVETEFIHIADHHFSPCIHCMKCYPFNKPAGDPPMCYNDPLDESMWLSEKRREADAVVIGFPIYQGHRPAACITALEAGMGGGAESIASASGERWWGDGYKPQAIISQGGNVYSNQETEYFEHFVRAGPFVSVAWPTVEDPEPQASYRGGLLTCQHGLEVFRKDAWTSAGSRVWPPLTGIQNERTLRNLGRWLAVATMLMKLARLACKEAGIQAPQTQGTQGIVRYAQKPKPGTITDRLMKAGKQIYVSEEELKERMKVRA